jgi:serine/threonine-protein kinase
MKHPRHTAEPAESVLAGTFVDGKFRVEERIGIGGMAAVYRAEQVHLGRPVAMKVLLRRHRSEGRRFYQEARLAMSIRHPNVVRTFDRGILPDGMPYMVMELLEGDTLGERLRDEGALPVDEAVTIAEQMLRALSAAHALGVIHRDLKPDNVFLTGGAEELHATLIDFGISRALDDAMPRMTLRGTTLGTPEYISPEQARGENDVDQRTDLWSAGVVLYECLTGRLPFGTGDDLERLLVSILRHAPEPPGRFSPEIPASLETVVLTALEKRPRDRYRTADDMLHALYTAMGRPSTVVAGG